jgi:hypothetical protein
MIPELRFLANAHHPSRGSLTFQTPTALIAFDRLTFSDRFLILFSVQFSLLPLRKYSFRKTPLFDAYNKGSQVFIVLPSGYTMLLVPRQLLISPLSGILFFTDKSPLKRDCSLSQSCVACCAAKEEIAHLCGWLCSQLFSQLCATI